MILMLDVFNEPSFIMINVYLFFDNNDAQFEKDGFKKDVIDLINIKDNNYLIVI